MLKDYKLEQAVIPLVEWFAAHARILPWRSEPTPYRVWVSEIMLQQTRVETVKPYFERFIKELPDVRALAACPEDELLKLWEGLGYYNRVRNMQKAAVQMVADHDGKLPADYETLLSLKGIGHYTAGAVASIAYGQSVPAVDGNVLRVITRLAADTTDIAKQSFRSEVEKTLFSLMRNMEVSDGIRNSLCRGNLPGTLNQAWMELGATVCLPNGEPLCGECPCRSICQAEAQGKIGEIPVKSKAKARKIERRTVFVIHQGDRVALRKRPSEGLLAGLYELPNVEGKLQAEEALAWLGQMHLYPIRIRPLPEAKHIFSHIEWHMTGFAVRIEEPDFSETETEAEENLIFVETESAREQYAIPSAFAAYVTYIRRRLLHG